MYCRSERLPQERSIWGKNSKFWADGHCHFRSIEVKLRRRNTGLIVDGTVKSYKKRWFGALRLSIHTPIPNSGEIDDPDEENSKTGAKMVKLVVRDRETIQEAVRRFRKLVERSGIKKEMRRREFYEKPSETNRRNRLRAERRSRRTRLLSR